MSIGCTKPGRAPPSAGGMPSKANADAQLANMMAKPTAVLMAEFMDVVSKNLPLTKKKKHAIHHLPDKAKANHLNLGLMTHVGLTHGRYASQRMGLVATSPAIHK